MADIKFSKHQIAAALGLSLPRKILGISGPALSLEKITDNIFRQNPEYNLPDAAKKAQETVDEYLNHKFKILLTDYVFAEINSKDVKKYRLAANKAKE